MSSVAGENTAVGHTNSVAERTGSRPRDNGAISDGFFQGLVDNLADGVYFVDCDRKITYWNKAAEEITGYTSREVVGHSCSDNLLVHTDNAGRQLCLETCPLLKSVRDRATTHADVFLKHKNGHRVPVQVSVAPIHNDAGAVIGGVELFRDNSMSIAALEKARQLEQLALLDELTGAGNRRLTESVLQETWDRFQRHGERFAVLFFDLDHFKSINDHYGHQAGDAVLQAVSKTLTNTTRSFDFLGRWGGDEFLMVVSACDEQHAANIAQRCCGLVRSCAITCGSHVIRVGTSVGAAVIEAGESVEEVIRRADTNLYRAKLSGRDKIAGFCKITGF